MRRVGALRPLTCFLTWLSFTALAGCGGGGKSSAGSSALTFERLADSSEFSGDGQILKSFDAFRLPDRSLRVKARVGLPEGTRAQVSIKTGPDHATLVSVNALVLRGEIESPPMVSETGPLPLGRYQFEISAQFAPGWQPPAILRATDNGKRLRGPGILRTRGGRTMVLLVEEMTR